MNFDYYLNKSLGLESVDIDINVADSANTDDNGALLSPVESDGELNVEAQQTEIVEDSNEIESDVEDVEESMTDTETLESLYFALERSLNRGGLDTASFEMVNITVDHIMRKHGIGANDLLPSMESFSSDARAQTIISMEKIGEIAKNIKNTVADFIAKIWTKIQRLFKSIAGLFNNKLAKRAKAISEKTKSSEDHFRKGKKVQVLNSHYLVSGSGITASGVVKGIETFGSVAYEWANMTTQMVKNSVKTYSTTFTNNKENAAEHLLKDLLKPKKLTYDLGIAKASIVFKAGSVPPGPEGPNYRIIHYTGDLKVDAVEDNSRGANQLDALLNSDIENIVKAVMELAKDITEIDKEVHSVDFKEINKMLKGEGASMAVRFVYERAFKHAVTVAQKLFSKVSSTSIKVSKAALDWCAASLAVNDTKGMV